MTGGNQAVHLNPPNATEHISTNGSDWLWTVFSIMGLSALLAGFATVLVDAFLSFDTFEVLTTLHRGLAEPVSSINSRSLF